ncbi:small multi-drug export protein [Haloechinothrix sp. LS1_15]|nr:small multi-drug export protein [Haloechinothrix sp. LS1_15]
MSVSSVLMLIGVFLGGAAPWLEAIVVIPAGIVAGLHPAPTVIVGLVGNLLTVALAAWFGERIRLWWFARRRQRVTVGAGAGGADEQERPASWARVERVMNRWGLPALAVLGPIGLGTQLSALVAVGLGVRPRVAFAWIGIATIVWSILAAIAAVTGMSIAGIG